LASTINASNSGFGGIVSTGDSSGQLQLQTAATTAVTIDTSQNVGIGTTSPVYKLDVVGSLNVTADSYYRIGAGTDRFITYRTGNSDILYSFASGYFYRQDIGNSNHSWWTAGSERMRIDSSGYTLIGTTSQLGGANNQLNIKAADIANTAYGIAIQNAATSTGGRFINFVNSSNTTNGYISQTNSTTVAYTTSSDYRLKENIKPLQNALDRVSLLKPVTFTWKESNDIGEGFIAHELAEIIPDAVCGNKDDIDNNGNPKYQGVDTSFLVATLTAAIQEQQTIINDLKARIETLEAK
jgi:hypothetical protein